MYGTSASAYRSTAALPSLKEKCAFFSTKTGGRGRLALSRAPGLGCATVRRRLLPTTNRLTDTHADKKKDTTKGLVWTKVTVFI